MRVRQKLFARLDRVQRERGVRFTYEEVCSRVQLPTVSRERPYRERGRAG